MSEIVSAGRLLTLRVAYAVGAPTVLAIGLTMPTARRAFTDGTLAMPPGFAALVPTMMFVTVGVLIMIAGLFGFLALRPYPWGKLIAAWAGLAWVGNGAMSALSGSEPSESPELARITQFFAEIRPVVLTCGLIMLGIVLICLIADRRLIGTYARTA